jgi:ABC-type phosphate transport system substrate-binding protein
MSWQKYFILVVIMLAVQVALAGSPGIVFIVNKSNPVDRISVITLREYYFKKKRFWNETREHIRFIDRTNGELRDNFLRKFIGKTSSDVELFWIGQKLYSGDSAPLKESSDASVINFVANLKGGLGYVSEGTFLPEKVKILNVITAGD